jgi:hypothetical protein
MSERLFVKVFDRQYFNRGVVKEKVFLPVNPYSVTFRTGRVVNEMQTARMGRFVLLDWGVEMTDMTIESQTGRILPFDEVFKDIGRFEDLTYIDLVSHPIMRSEVGLPMDKPLEERVRDLLDRLRDVSDDSSDIGEFSKYRYLLVKALEHVYRSFNANSEIMCVEWMRRRYFGVISEFSYEISVLSLWNIKFSFRFKCFPRVSLLDRFLNAYNEEVVRRQ